MNAISLPRALCAVLSTAFSSSRRDNLRGRAARSLLIVVTTFIVSIAYLPANLLGQSIGSKSPSNRLSTPEDSLEKTLSPDTQKALQEALPQKQRIEQLMKAGEHKKALLASSQKYIVEKYFLGSITCKSRLVCQVNFSNFQSSCR